MHRAETARGFRREAGGVGHDLVKLPADAVGDRLHLAGLVSDLTHELDIPLDLPVDQRDRGVDQVNGRDDIVEGILGTIGQGANLE